MSVAETKNVHIVGDALPNMPWEAQTGGNGRSGMETFGQPGGSA